MTPRTPGLTRREFVEAAATAAVGLPLLQEKGPEVLALRGGPKAVTGSDTEARRWPLYGPEEEKAILSLVRRPSYDPIAALEKDWKAFLGVEHVKAHCNGTSALASIFFALDLPPGSEIMVPSYTWWATIVPMRLFGYVPVFVDINPHTLNFDLEDAKKRLTPRTRAILPVHWLGLPCDMDAICDWADQKGLIVLEDAAHAHGARLKGKFMGTWGRMAMFSFQASKPLPAIEGGMGVYRERDDRDRATAFGNFDHCAGKFEGYKETGLGLKFRMHPFAAALASCQLAGLATRTAAGAAQVRRLNDRLIQLPGLSEQRARTDSERIYYSNNVLFIDEAKAGISRQACVGALTAEGVRVGTYRYTLQHKLRIYSEPAWWHHPPVLPAELPGSDRANATAISLPYFTSEQPELVEQYAKAFEKVWAHRSELR